MTSVGMLLWANGLFRRQPGDPFYEAKVGAGELASALLRLNLRLRPERKELAECDWTFLKDRQRMRPRAGAANRYRERMSCSSAMPSSRRFVSMSRRKREPSE